MKKLVVVIGYKNSGKSTIIQSLTGCPTKSFCDFVIDEDTKNSVFVIASSPQEDPMTEEKLHQILDSVIAKGRCSGVVIAIQPTRMPAYPWKRYLRLFSRLVVFKYSYLFFILQGIIMMVRFKIFVIAWLILMWKYACLMLGDFHTSMQGKYKM